MVNEITEEEVRNDVTGSANVLFERGMTDDPVGVVDAWVRRWRSGDLVPFVPRTGACAGRPDPVGEKPRKATGECAQSAAYELNEQNAEICNPAFLWARKLANIKSSALEARFQSGWFWEERESIQSLSRSPWWKDKSEAHGAVWLT